jgi:hypothetical protein
MPMRIVPNGPPASDPTIRRFNFSRPLAIGAALVLWAAILVGLKLLTV